MVYNNQQTIISNVLILHHLNGVLLPNRIFEESFAFSVTPNIFSAILILSTIGWNPIFIFNFLLVRLSYWYNLPDFLGSISVSNTCVFFSFASFHMFKNMEHSLSNHLLCLPVIIFEINLGLNNLGLYSSIQECPYYTFLWACLDWNLI